MEARVFANVKKAELDDGDCKDWAAQEAGAGDGSDELGVVPLADTLVEPLAVVVKALNALVAQAAVLSPFICDVDAAPLAPCPGFCLFDFGSGIFAVNQGGLDHGVKQNEQK